MAKGTKPEVKPIPNHIKFLFAGSAGMIAACFVQPLELLKNRMQLTLTEKERVTSLQLLTQIVKHEGILALFTGLSAAVFRQATYTTTRLGVYTWLFEKLSKEEKPGFLVKAGLGMFAGSCGAFVGTPADVCLIRMTADGRLPPSQRRNYKNVFDAMKRIVKEEGFFTLWRGAIPTMGRAMIVNAAQLSTYSQSKQILLDTEKFADGIFLHFCASMISGFITTCVSMPVDILKTRMQNMKTVDGKPEYSGSADIFYKIIRNEGLLALWKGFTPYYFRLAPLTVLIFVFLEQMNSAYNKYVLGQSGTGKGL